MNITPKQKANELIELFYAHSGDMEKDDIQHAKKCAYILLNEIIPKLEYYVEQYDHGLFINNLNFYKEVKQEIEKL